MEHSHARFIGIIFLIPCLIALACKFGASNANSQKPSNSIPANRAATTDQVFTRNLILNGDAESDNGNGSCVTGEADRVTGWAPNGNVRSEDYGHTGGDPDVDTPGPPNRGRCYFRREVGSGTPQYSASQTINVSTATTAIDAGTVNYSMSGWFGGIAGDVGSAKMIAIFKDASGKELAKVETDPVTHEERGDQVKLIQRSKAGKVPEGTRQIEVQLQVLMYDTSCANCETVGYADNLSLVLTKSR